MNELPERKHTRLEHFDYCSNGAYFITICTQNREWLLSHITERSPVSDGTDILTYTIWGEIAKRQLLLLEKRYPCLAVDQYVIMPNHIHVILFLSGDAAGASPRPTVMDIICAYKSLTTRECRNNGFENKLFQTSFYEHIIRDQKDYDEINKYIYENPILWYWKEMHP